LKRGDANERVGTKREETEKNARVLRRKKMEKKNNKGRRTRGYRDTSKTKERERERSQGASVLRGGRKGTREARKK